MNQFLKRAKELESQLQTDRRYLHQHAEAGEDLPNTTRYVMERLREIGLTPTEICPSGVTALIEGAKPGKVLLLRADMDALPMPENNDLPFKTETDAAHNCGHDFHTAMWMCCIRSIFHLHVNGKQCNNALYYGSPLRTWRCHRNCNSTTCNSCCIWYKEIWTGLWYCKQLYSGWSDMRFSYGCCDL